MPLCECIGERTIASVDSSAWSAGLSSRDAGSCGPTSPYIPGKRPSAAAAGKLLDYAVSLPLTLGCMIDHYRDRERVYLWINVMTEPLCCRFEEIADFVVPVPPPEYPEPLRACDYCGSEHPDEQYKDHLISAHSDFLFQCDECDTYVHRKDFILHMSLHAVQYASTEKKVTKKVKKLKKKKDKDENENTESDQKSDGVVEEMSEQTESIEIQVPDVTVSVNEDRNEFSDQSDGEYLFGPLPESVFEAIEDSQDSQPTDEIHTPDITEHNDNINNDQQETSQEPKQKKHKKSRTCPICSKVYNASSSYFYHMKYFHNSVKEHECDVCGRKFGTKGSLSQHSTIHTGECQFECKDCGKKFRSKASLYIHEQTHNGIKTWACNQCHISFRWRTHLVRHMKRHSAEKAHVCSTCGRGFNIKCDLLRHARTHTAGNFSCEKCGVKFAQLRYLKVHMDKKHSATVNGSENVPSA